AALLALPALDRRLPSAALGGLVAGGTAAGVAFAVYLAATGTLGLFFEASVLFPLRGYRQPGGPNDLRLLADLPYRLGVFAGLDAPWAVRALLAAGQICAVLAAGAIALWSALTAVHHLLERWSQSRWHALRDAGARLLPVATAAACLLVRPDVLHLSFYALLPTALAVLAGDRQTSWRWLYVDRCGRWLLALCCALGFAAHLALPLSQGAAVPPVFGRITSIDPALDGLPAVDAAMVQQDPRLYFVRRYGLDHPGKTLFAASQGAQLYFFGMPPAVRQTLLYSPVVKYHAAEDYLEVLRQLEARPPGLVAIVPVAEAADFLLPPPAAGAAVQALARFLRSRYQPMGNIGDAIFLTPRQEQP
ncbi:MAG: hypothetical protein JXR83_18855, partial [Deltaproteobacteria bacterium]|nr:hypothetical protein [Deltaproteobacteria bacterium]